MHARASLPPRPPGRPVVLAHLPRVGGARAGLTPLPRGEGLLHLGRQRAAVVQRQPRRQARAEQLQRRGVADGGVRGGRGRGGRRGGSGHGEQQQRARARPRPRAQLPKRPPQRQRQRPPQRREQQQRHPGGRPPPPSEAAHGPATWQGSAAVARLVCARARVRRAAPPRTAASPRPAPRGLGAHSTQGRSAGAGAGEWRRHRQAQARARGRLHCIAALNVSLIVGLCHRRLCHVCLCGIVRLWALGAPSRPVPSCGPWP